MALRQQLQAKYNIPEGWWLPQHRVTAKTGWITTTAAERLYDRVVRQIASCMLGIEIVKAAKHFK